jgi:hypothetical protein
LRLWLCSHDAVGKVDADDLGARQLKNIVRLVRRAFTARIGLGSAAVTTPSIPSLALPDKPSIAVMRFGTSLVISVLFGDE